MSGSQAPQGRPSDEDILNFENKIREEEVNVHPLVSTRLPLSILEEEYAKGENTTNFTHKIAELKRAFSSTRKTRGDGNCFFRAISYGLVEAVSCLGEVERAQTISKLDHRITELLQGAGFDKMAYDDFYEELLSALRDVNVSVSSDYLAELWQAEPHRSHSLVVLLRLATSAYLRAHSQQYEPFIWEAGLDMIGYCQRFVECLGVESDQIHAIALGKALQIDVEIAYLNGSDGPLSRLSFPAAETTPSPIKVILLYRPGHYDLLYPL